MSIAAAELPELARERDGAADVLRARVSAALRRVAFLVVPSFVAFVLLGDVLVAGIYRAGEFGARDVTSVWLVLAVYSAGLIASTSTRVYQSAFYALRNTKTPARVAGLRVLTAAVAGAVLMVQFEPVTVRSFTIPAGVFAGARVAGLPLGPIGLALGAVLGSWLEWTLLRRKLVIELGRFGAGGSQLARMFGAALVAAGAGYGVKLASAALHPLLAALLVAGAFGAAYFAAAHALRLDDARALAGALLRRARRR
jgi:putative peptidoglycan lipid II flippase